MTKRTIVLPSAPVLKISEISTPDSSFGYNLSFKIRMMGDSGVGKSSILLRAVDNIFSNNFISTIGVDFKILMINVGGKVIRLQLWDIAGQERFGKVESGYAAGTDANMFVFDITDKISFNNLKKWIEEEGPKYCNEKSPIIIVANKYDLLGEREVVVDAAAITAFVNSLDPNREVIVIGTSAKTGLNIEELMTKTVEALCRTRGIELGAAALANSLTYKKQIDSDWNKASGSTTLEKAIATLSIFTGGGSAFKRTFSMHPWRHGADDAQKIINNHITQTPIKTLGELVEKLECIPNLPKDCYLSDFITYLKNGMYPQPGVAPGTSGTPTFTGKK
ncbi:MAG: GTP-binding protein [Proteobacteria bacterium]|nr:GTP-binding protein [Pseudomonadota bacterium]